MSLGTILLVIIILMLIGVIPAWPHSREWGYRNNLDLNGQNLAS
jgi:Protein of unknown function (DUF3309)